MITAQPTFAPNATPDQRIQAVQGLVQQLRQNPTRPILLGPWRSELGFEVLYWIPFLAWLKAQVPNFDQRAKVVTRGGLAPLYREVACQGYDLYALRSVTDVRRANLADHQATSMQKQLAITAWDQAVMEDAARALGHSPVVDQVHPAWMYWALTPVWEEQVGHGYLAALTAYGSLPKPARPAGLPDRYVVVKFYARATFPYPDPEVAAWIRRTVGVLASQTPVVDVALGSQYDDHLAIPLTGPHVVRLAPETTPETNLLAQAAVIAHATAFVGTYGGTAQLALRLGVPSVSVWKAFGGTAQAHLALSHRIGVASKVAFVTGSLDDTWLLQQCLMVPPASPVPMGPAVLTMPAVVSEGVRA